VVDDGTKDRPQGSTTELRKAHSMSDMAPFFFLRVHPGRQRSRLYNWVRAGLNFGRG